jgi:hypothetical protein
MTMNATPRTTWKVRHPLGNQIAERRRNGMIEQGGGENAEDDGNRLAEPGGQNDGQELCLVTDFRDSNDRR